MTEESKIIWSNLEKYSYMKIFLGNIINQRLAITDCEHGMLTACLLDEPSKPDLERLDHALQLGKSLCTNFKMIFGIGRLPQNPEQADGRIIDMLAEVKAFEFLYNWEFKDITYLRQKADTRTVDFTARINGDNYAIEVTRLGLPQSDTKKPVYLAKGSSPNQGILEWFLISGSDNVPKFKKTIAAAIENEYRQVEEFCLKQSGVWKGIVIISVGRDYFVTKYARRDLDMFPNRIRETVKDVWNMLKENQKSSYQYLHHVAVILGKTLDKVLIHPEFVSTRNGHLRPNSP